MPVILKLKLKLTPFSIAHRSKGNPFQGALNSKHMLFRLRYNKNDE